MDKKGLTGLLLIAGILMVWQYINAPTQEELEAMKATEEVVDSTLNAPIATPNVSAELAVPPGQTDSIQDSIQNALLLSQYGSLAPSAEGQEAYTTVTTPLITAVFSNKGGRMVNVKLNDYTTYEKTDLVLFNEDSTQLDFAFNFENRTLNASSLFFTPQVIAPKNEGDSTVVVFTASTTTPGRYIQQVYTFRPDDYMASYSINFVGMSDVVAQNNNSIMMNWHMRPLNKEKGIELQRQKTTFFFRTNDGDTDYLSEGRDDEEVLELPAQWISFKQQFFSVALISNNSFKSGTTELISRKLESTDYIADLTAHIDAELTNGGIAMDLYMGPNGYSQLKKYGVGLDEQIDLGWGIFGWVNRFLVINVFNLLDGTGMSYGIIILILTIFIKLLLSPITYKTYLSSAKMKVLKPEINEINEKYKDGDNLKKQQAIMDLYKQTGVNPMSGCVPMLIQMPILYAMFRFFPASLELRQESFLWADDLSAYDTLFPLPFDIPFYGDHVSGFTLLMGISMIFYTRNNSQMSMGGGLGGAQEQQMKIMMWMMPIMMIVFFNSFAAGLTYYYFISNVITLLQQYVIKNFIIDEEKIHAKLQANKLKPKKKSKFAQKLDEMAQAQGQQQNRSMRRKNS